MKALANDTRESILSWRKWYLIGMQSIRAAYARSRIGHFWITFLFMTLVVTLGFIYTALWQVRIEEFLPFFALSQLIWVFMSGVTLEAAHTYQAYAGYIKAQYQPKSIFVFAGIFKHLVILAHNAVVVIAVYVYFWKPVSWVALLTLPGLLVLVLNCYWIALVVALACARFRDIPSVVASLVQITFFISPILWPPTAVKNPELKLLLIDLNPVANLMAIVRDPLMGTAPSVSVYLYCAAFTLLGLGFAGIAFAKGHRRLVYWI